MTVAPNQTITSLIEALKDKYNRRALPIELSDYLVRCLYPEIIPYGYKDEGEQERPIYTFLGTQLATGYQRIVYSDYGPYLEVGKDYIVRSSLRQSSGTSKEAESNMTTFLSYTSNDGLASVRFQTREGPKRATASETQQRNFSASKYYISVFDACPGDLIEIKEGDLMPDLNHSWVCQSVNCHGRYRDGISREVSQKWPFVKEEYEDLCKEHDSLSLLGTFQAIATSDESEEGVINIFCDMNNGNSRRQASVNYNSLVEAIYNACTEVPDQHIIIPYGIGCLGKEQDWPELHLKLSCRLMGQNVTIMKQRVVETPVEAPVERNEFDVLDSVAAVMAAEVVPPTVDDVEVPHVSTADIMGCACDLIEKTAAEDRPCLHNIFREMMSWSPVELQAFAVILERRKPQEEED